MTYAKHILAGLAAIVLPALAQAQPPIVVEGLPTAIVNYADLDLSSPAGQAALDARVRRAAQSLCDVRGVRDIGQAMASRSCLTFALGHAQGQVERAVAQYGNTQFAGRRAITVAGR
jgi:UrcA family protein